MIKSFGLDIGVTTIKAISLDVEKGKFILNSYASLSAPSKGMLSESAFDQEEMVQAIKKVTANLKNPGRNVNIALADNQVYTKVVDMPSLSDKELSLAIYWEAEQYIPVPLSTITLVWTVLKRPQNPQISDEKMQVLMIGAPTLLINKYQKILSSAGLNLVSLETEILSAIRTLTYSNSPQSIIISIGAVNTSLAIIREGTLVFTYSIPTGGAAISRSIEADFGLTPDQSDAFKKTYGISQDGIGKEIGKSTEPILFSILSEVKKALAFYSEKYKDSVIQQVLLSGGTAKLPGIDLFFASNLGIETVIADPWKKFGGQEIPKEILVSSSDYTIAIGLAMKGYEY